MTDKPPAAGMRTYWITWGVLLALTLVMIGLDVAPLPRALFVGVMLAAMTAKASLIGGVFMHLGYERLTLVASVVVGLIITGGLLYMLIVPDAYRIAEMAGR